MKSYYVFMAIAFGAVFHLSSCTNDDVLSPQEQLMTRSSVYSFTQDEAMARFSNILSKATYQNKEVREFLKKEAIKQFDKNYDVLYAKVKDYPLRDETFAQVLAKYASPGELDAIFNTVPTLNIYVSNIAMFNVKPETLDCNDPEIPVVLPNEKNNLLYLNGQVVDSIKQGEVPDFHTFVVNCNSRVRVNTATRSAGPTYTFIDDAFDGEKPQTRSELVGYDMVGSKAIQAYRYFNRDDGSNYSKALQRDYIYYGMTPNAAKGNLNYNVSEYLTFIEVNPRTYFNMVDDNDPSNPKGNDPDIKHNIAWRKGRDFTQEELVNEFWTQGTYNIKVNIIYSTKGLSVTKYIPVKPEEIWNFNYDREVRHHTGFRHSKYLYWIHPEKFTAKRYDVSKLNISFEKWNLAEEALSRIVHFYEEDRGGVRTDQYSYETTRLKSNKVNGDLKFGLGVGPKDQNKIDVSVGGDASYSTTEKINHTVTYTSTDKDDDLGSAIIYFYDPIIESTSNGKYNVKTYDTGRITFGITAR